MLVENIKAYLQSKGLNWTGEIVSHKGKKFRPATEDDFKFLSCNDYLIDFGEAGEVVLSIEIDEMTFRCYGETFDIAYSNYAGKDKEIKKLIKTFEDKDLSKEFIKFQLKNSGLVYAAALRMKCVEKKQQINEESERRQKQFKRKIEYLNRCIEKNENARIRDCKEIEKIIQLANDEENY